jgi:hypothetical protein
MDTPTIIALVTPIIIIDLILVVFSLWDLTRPERRVRWLPKPVWAVIILFISTIGALAYLLLAREDA